MRVGCEGYVRCRVRRLDARGVISGKGGVREH